jgi:hypothetical protein
MNYLVFACVVVASLPVAAAPCPSIELAPKPFTSAKATIGDGGGIVVVHERRAADEPVLGAIKDWRFVDKAKRTAPAVKVIAPGLELLEPAGTQLVDASGKPLVDVARGKATALAPPEIVALRFQASSAGRRTITWVTAELRTAPTEDRILITFDEDGKSRSWARAKAKATSVGVFSTGGCGGYPNGTVPTAAGDTIRFAWIDRAGRLSRLTKPVEVTSTVQVPQP